MEGPGVLHVTPRTLVYPRTETLLPFLFFEKLKNSPFSLSLVSGLERSVSVHVYSAAGEQAYLAAGGL